MQKLSILRFKIGTVEMKKVLVVFITLLPKEDYVLVKIPIFLGHKLKQDHQLLGNIQVAYY